MILHAEAPATDASEPEQLAEQAPTLASSAAALDIVVRWDDWVLAVFELSPPRPFFLGEQNADVLVPEEVLGARRLPVVQTRWDGEVHLVVPKSARLLLGGQTKRLTAARLLARGIARASSTLTDAAEVPFLPGQTATLFFGKIAVDFAFSAPAPYIERKPLFEKRVVWAQMASFVVHMVLLGILLSVGPAEVDLIFGMSVDQLNEFQRRLWRVERAEMRRRWDYDTYDSQPSRDRLAYRFDSPAAKQIWMDSLEGAANRWTQEMAAEAEARDVPPTDDRGLIGIIYDWPSPPPPPKRRLTIDEVMKMPALLTPEEKAQRGKRSFSGPILRFGEVIVSGRLPPEVISRIVRQRFGNFRLCYERGLRDNPNLQGRIGVRFVIGRDGATSNTGNGGSDMPDARVVRCVVSQFQTLEFPPPSAGIATVVMPIIFSPGD